MKDYNEIFGKLKPFEDVYDVPRLPRVDKETWDNCIVPNLIKAGAIPKNKLKHNNFYIGKCRNATVAKWDKHINKFIYKRTKFGQEFDEEINHFEDDDGFDLFVPIKEKT